jgi:hypothetical protein
VRAGMLMPAASVSVAKTSFSRPAGGGWGANARQVVSQEGDDKAAPPRKAPPQHAVPAMCCGCAQQDRFGVAEQDLGQAGGVTSLEEPLHEALPRGQAAGVVAGHPRQQRRREAALDGLGLLRRQLA